LPFVIFLAVTALSVGVVSSYALLSAIIDALAAMMILAPAALAGLWLVPIKRMAGVPRRWHLLLGACLGLGGMPLLVLAMGLAGRLDRNLWDTLLIALALAGVIKLRRILLADTSPRAAGFRLRGGSVSSRPLERATREPTVWHRLISGAFRPPWVWLAAIPFLVLALLAAANAPGMIWSEEGYGYDVLEYHLEMPREYYEAGRIEYARHNVYANFPAAVEMYYLLTMVVFDDALDVGTKANLIHLTFAVLTVLAAWVIGRDGSAGAGVISALAAASTGWLIYLSGLAYVENAMLFFGMVSIGCALRAFRAEGGARVWIIFAGIAAGFACGCKYTAIAMIAAPIGIAILAASPRALARRAMDVLVFTLACLAAFSPWLIKNAVMTGNPVFPLANSVFSAVPEGWGEAETERFDAAHTIAPDERTVGARIAAMWNRTVADSYQRFGPAVLLLAVGGLIGRRRERTDVVLAVVLVAQALVWLLATHLFARFAVVLLIPLVLLAGRSVFGGASRGRSVVIAVVLIAGCAWSFTFAARLNAAESPNGAPASWIYNGELPAYSYLAAVNRELPEDARILLVGEARALYFRRAVDYFVVFNRNPFVETVRAAASDEDIVAWLRDRGYTHVLVNWLEVARLARTYGFAEEITPALFARLESAGLVRTHRFLVPEKTAVHVEMYEVR
jgi:hypothetical protein